jgi:hypothetical protein
MNEKKSMSFRHKKENISPSYQKIENIQIDKQEFYLKLNQILTDEKIKDLFTKHCKKEENIENLLFLEKLEKFKILEEKEEKEKESVKEIINDFLTQDSKNELNINVELKNEIIQKYENNDINKDIFKNLEKEIIFNMNDSFLRFQKTDEFVEFEKTHQINLIKQHSIIGTAINIKDINKKKKFFF